MCGSTQFTCFTFTKVPILTRAARLAWLAQHAETVSLLEATQEEAARKTKELEEELRVLKEQEKVEREQAFADVC